MNKTSERGREFHAKAESAREAGEFLEALQYTDEAMIAYAEDGDIFGFAEVLQSRVLTASHLAEKTGSDLWLRYALHTSMAGVEAAEKSGDKSATVIPYHIVGKIHEPLGEYEEALSWHQKAVDNLENLPEMHNRDGYKAEVSCHLHFCQMMTGDESGYEGLLGDVEKLENSSEPKYNKDTWLSGTHMRAAQGLKEVGRVDEAREHLQKAKAIIDANLDLKLRKGQWEKLNASF